MALDAAQAQVGSLIDSRGIWHAACCSHQRRRARTRCRSNCCNCSMSILAPFSHLCLASGPDISAASACCLCQHGCAHSLSIHLRFLAITPFLSTSSPWTHAHSLSVALPAAPHSMHECNRDDGERAAALFDGGPENQRRCH